jgi:hypothetical protein
VGAPAAALAMLVTAVTLTILFGNSDYNKGVIGAAAWFCVLGIVYYAGHGRRQLVLAPEEESTLAHRRENSRV